MTPTTLTGHMIPLWTLKSASNAYYIEGGSSREHRDATTVYLYGAVESGPVGFPGGGRLFGGTLPLRVRSGAHLRRVDEAQHGRGATRHKNAKYSRGFYLCFFLDDRRDSD